MASDKHDLDEWLKMFWNLESLGITEGECSVYEDIEESICFKNGRYEVHLPWKDPDPILANNDLS